MTTPESLEFHGMPAVRWRSRDGASAMATLQGAQLLSWQVPNGEECLYLSERSPFKAGRPIRGGIPVCFPQFADRGPLAQHGFARNNEWRFIGVSESQEGVSASFELATSAESSALWPGDFRLELSARIGGQRLDVELRITNCGQFGFAFNAALHTYLRVAEAAGAHLVGLQGLPYVNRGASNIEVEERATVTAAEPIDRVYFATPPLLRLSDASRILRIEQRGFTDTVVWNPGRERTAQMVDMPADGFRHFVCVEGASIEPPVELAPQGVWSGGQSIEVSR